MAEIQKGVVKGGKRNAISRVFHAKNDQGAIAAWRLDLNRILALNLAKEVSSVTPAKAAFGSVSVLLTMIMVRLLFSCDASQTHM